MMRFLPIILIIGCKTGEPPVYPEPAPLVAGAPRVGAAQAAFEMPVGTPLSGYTARCSCASGWSRPDKRDSAYNYTFVESAGVHVTPGIAAIWVENGDDHLLTIKTDSIYSFDGLPLAISERLEELTGEELTGKVVHTTNHSHASWGAFSQAKAFYLGHDRYNEEIFQRFVTASVDVAMEAYENRQPAKIGIGWAKDWDPNDRVYRDRRGANNDLAVWDDREPGMGKDPHLAVVRYDTLDDEPIAMTVNFGIHGIVISDEGAMASAEAGGSIEAAVREAFDEEVVVMFTQGAGGDASPAGISDEDFAKYESLGVLAVDAIYDLWSQTPTSAEPIVLHTASRHIPQYIDQIQVTRNGTVDWYYTDYDEDANPDDIIYTESGELASPIDEFNTKYGAAFCGTGNFDFPVGGLASEVYPYNYCLEVELVSQLITAFFDIEPGEMPLPLPETLKAGTTASRLGPISTLTPEGETVEQDLFIGFFPGESTAMYVEQWRRRVRDELGFENSLHISYSQDHEGYLLIPEDWLLGEYESDITIWGPLQGEHIMEGVLQMGAEVLSSDKHEDPDPWKQYTPTTYWEEALPTIAPDPTPDAGTKLMESPEWDLEDSSRPERIWLPWDFQLALNEPTELPRVQGSRQLLWIGGDPAVDFPNVTLQRLEGEDWVTVTTVSGREVSEEIADILIAHTPDPLYPADAEQTHYWWATWQAVGPHHMRAKLPLGTYRLHVSGQRYSGGATTWPWPSEPYEVAGEPFELLPAALTLLQDTGGLLVSIEGPADGFRLVHIDGHSRGHNPIEGPALLSVYSASGLMDEITIDPTSTADGKSRIAYEITEDAVSVTVTDAYGNTGSLSL
jgi:neutral ceramidase